MGMIPAGLQRTPRIQSFYPTIDSRRYANVLAAFPTTILLYTAVQVTTIKYIQYSLCQLVAVPGVQPYLWIYVRNATNTGVQRTIAQIELPTNATGSVNDSIVLPKEETLQPGEKLVLQANGDANTSIVGVVHFSL